MINNFSNNSPNKNFQRIENRKQFDVNDMSLTKINLNVIFNFIN